MMQFFKFKWLINKKVGVLLLCTLIIIGSIVINMLGIQYFGSIEHWDSWLKQHTGLFLFWRIVLYAGTVAGWFWMRKRLLQREPQAKTCLIRAEICAVAALLLMEISNLMVEV